MRARLTRGYLRGLYLDLGVKSQGYWVAQPATPGPYLALHKRFKLRFQGRQSLPPQHLTDPRECSGGQRAGEVEQAEADGEAHHPQSTPEDDVRPIIFLMND